MLNCMNPRAGFFRIGDIVEDEIKVAILKEDGQIQHFRKSKEDPVLPAPAENKSESLPPDEGLGEGTPPEDITPVIPEESTVPPPEAAPKAEKD